ncbi:MAG: DNA cytosine methyltransferase [Bacteroidales bacterium]|nr:DNA cytosine methyltransferase [Bacteroidales bacterium]
MSKLKAISLFSGAMGLDLGIEKAGIDIKLCVELNKQAASTIRNNTKIPVIDRDITTVPYTELLKVSGLKAGEVDLVVGGPPCQAFSTAGARRGLDDFRGNVIIQYLRVVSELQPKYFILENVRGILSAKLNTVPEVYKEYKGIKDLKGSVIRFLANEFKKFGYTISFALFNAANYGVPQIRERVIIFGAKGNKRIPLPQPTHSELGLNGTEKWVTLGDVINDLPEPLESEYTPLSKRMLQYMPLVKEGENWTSLEPSTAKEAMGKAYELGGGKTGFLRRLSNSKPAPTLVTSPIMPATLICHPTELRPLSVKEYARVQQFPDDWEFSGKIADIYKQIGNAVPVGLGYMAGKQIIRFDNGELKGNEDINNLIPYSRYKNTTDKDINLSIVPDGVLIFD